MHELQDSLVSSGTGPLPQVGEGNAGRSPVEPRRVRPSAYGPGQGSVEDWQVTDEGRKRIRSPAGVRSRARELRKTQTPAERLLWEHLRGRRHGDLKFRRQHPIGRFIVDFFCPEAKLILEVDGPTHDEQVEDDAWRTGQLQAQGYSVLRFKNEDVTGNLESVLHRIRAVAVPRNDTCEHPASGS